MKIYLLFPRRFAIIFPPLGLFYIAAALEKAGHQVKIKDLFPNSDYDKTIEEVKNYQPDWVGVSITTYQFPIAAELISKIKQNIKNTRIVCGGVHATLFSREIIENLDVDFVICGEGELTVVDLCEAISNNKDFKNIKGLAYNQNGKAIINQPRELIEDLDQVPFPARHLVNFNSYLRPPGVMRGIWMKRGTTIMATRGCPGACTFCGSKIMFGRRIRRRSVANVIEELKLLKENYNIDGLYFVDDTLLANKVWLLEFLEEFCKLNYNLAWGCLSRVNNIDEEIAQALAKAGCKQLEFGVESGSQKVLKNLKKGTTVEQAINAFKIAKKYKIRPSGSFMVGSPGETYEDIDLTYKIVKKLKPAFVTFFYITPYPGTELYDYAKKNNYLKTEDFSKFEVREPGILEINFKKDELVRIRRKLQNSFMLTNIFSYLKNPRFMWNLLIFLIKNFKITFNALKAFMRTGVFDDLTFGIFSRIEIDKDNKV